jgi:molecular chaperone DnaK
VAQKMYQAQAAAGELAQGAEAQDAGADDAVDAEFEEVKDDKK